MICFRVITIVAGNLGGAALQGLTPGTQYQLAVTAVRAGRKMRSRPIVFRTLGKPAWQQQHEQDGQQQRHHRHRGAESPPRTGPHQEALGAGTVQVRGVEVGIVLVVLLVWAAAIALFFNRWGKIRMLLPYQPDYKEQLKAAAVVAPAPAHVPGQSCTQVK
ncbi:hypothetical protein B566_EDAN009006 [Ephemera danica]|nr:hypothetical protein B566_EDAN009006 [Ephemera danica]